MAQFSTNYIASVIGGKNADWNPNKTIYEPNYTDSSFLLKIWIPGTMLTALKHRISTM